jgi:hypothetical protein
LLLLFEASPPSEEEEEFACSGSKTALNRVVFDDKEAEEECEYNHPFLLTLSASFLSLRSSERRRPREEEEDAKQTDDDVAFRGEKRRGLLLEEEEAQPPLVVVVVAKPWHRRAHEEEEEEEEDRALLDFERPPPRLFQDGVVGVVVADIISFCFFPYIRISSRPDYKKKIFFSKSMSRVSKKRERDFFPSLSLTLSSWAFARVPFFSRVLSLSLLKRARAFALSRAFFFLLESLVVFRGQKLKRKM